jgi:metal-sulfur cluster biosynthetic enzyme
MAEVTSSEILDALRGVVDPEPGINIVDLGLVYETAARAGDVHVVMTMTTSACPLGESMADEAAAVIRRSVRGVKSVSVQRVWEPAWQPLIGFTDLAHRRSPIK